MDREQEAAAYPLRTSFEKGFPFDARAGGGRDTVLDGLRALAVVAVIVGHAILFRYAGLAIFLPNALARAGGSVAITGVQVFFVISGYVITRLLIKETRGAGCVNIKAFYVRRFFRIMPALTVYLVTIYILSVIEYINVDIINLVPAFMFSCNTGFFTCEWFGGHTWSLAVEEQFYIFWPALFVLVKEKYRVSTLTVIIAILTTVSIVRGYVFAGNDQSFTYIAAGALVASSIKIQRIVISGITPIVLLFLAFFLGVVIIFSPVLFSLILKPILLTLIIFGTGNVSWLSKILATKPFQLIGLTSYSAYLWQELFLAQRSAYNGLPPILILLPLMIWISWRLVEQPFMALGRAHGRTSLAARTAPFKA